MDRTYIVLPEDFPKWKWSNNAKVLSVFMFLLFNANTKERYRGKDKIKRGAIDVTNEIISESCGLTMQNVRTALACLEKTGDISRERRNRYQIITITDFEQYKDDV